MIVSSDCVHHQVAYVTSDLAQAQAVFADDYGVTRFLTFEGQVGADDGVTVKIALANVGGVEIELIEPGAGSNLYSDALPRDGGFAIVLHHIAQRVVGEMAAWIHHRANLDPARHPIVLEGGLGEDLRYAYTDERPRLGHYVEHVWMSPGLIERMGALVPRFPTTP